MGYNSAGLDCIQVVLRIAGTSSEVGMPHSLQLDGTEEGEIM